jgi:hypothetical protein
MEQMDGFDRKMEFTLTTKTNTMPVYLKNKTYNAFTKHNTCNKSELNNSIL